MEILLHALSDGVAHGDAQVFFVFKDEEPLAGIPGEWTGTEDVTGKAGEVRVLFAKGDAPVSRAVVVGLGKPGKPGNADVEALRNGAALGLRACRERKAERVVLDLTGLAGMELGPLACPPYAPAVPAYAGRVEEAVLGALLGGYVFESFKGKKKDKPENGDNGDNGKPSDYPKEFVLAGIPDGEAGEALRAAVARARAQYDGMRLTRDLINAPANAATPTHLAQVAEDMGKDYGFGVEILGPDEIRAKGMGAFESVFRGAVEPPRLIKLEYAPKGTEKDAPLVYVGKGVTFDTGGISIKPSAGMEEMKGDMGGAAAVLGFFKALGELGDAAPARRVMGFAPCTENMPGGNATRPGDIVTACDGQTIEVINTDAEGRLILCDVLAHAKEYEPAAIVDLATLTGACVVALGMDVAAVFSNRPVLSEALATAGNGLGDRFWPLPLWDLYDEALKSEYADMKNVGPRWGGAVHAAKFLERFVPEDTPWVHLDIAGPSWGDGKAPTHKPGGAGFGVRTLLALAETFGSVDLAEEE